MRENLPSADAVQAPFAGLEFSRVHTRNVARLGLSLFDQTASLHSLGGEERRLLWVAALLHDVGQGIEYVGHHKHSMALILQCEPLGLTSEERQIVACVARYHRGADPKASHPIYGELGREARATIVTLAALLRVADGLDRGQIGRVEEIRVTGGGTEAVTVRVYAPQAPVVELDGGARKAALFERVFGTRLSIEYGGRRP